MKETGLMFKAPLVRAILSGQKTQTRRLVEPQPAPRQGMVNAAYCGHPTIWLPDGPVDAETDPAKEWSCPFGKLGDRIYVRETVRSCRAYEVQGYPPSEWGNKPIWFEADGAPPGAASAWATKATPAIHMPKWSARIWLEITGVRVERLQSISEADARSEGITDGGCMCCGNPEPCDCATPSPSSRESFAHLWESTGGDWAANPWVWVIDFKRIEKP